MSHPAGTKNLRDKKMKFAMPRWFDILTSASLMNVLMPHLEAHEMIELNRMFMERMGFQRWLEDYPEGSRDPLSRLIRQFSDDAEYGIGRYWIKHVYHVCEESWRTTRDRLRWDIVHRLLIECLHNTRNQHISNGRYDSAQAIESRLDTLVRQRNLPLNQLHEVPRNQLKFDLHWFTLSKALDFVKELIIVVEESTTLLAHAGLAIPLLTGHGSHSVRARSDIQLRIFKLFGSRVTVDPENRGILLLHFKKKTTYSDVLFGEFPRSWDYRYCRFCNYANRQNIRVCRRPDCLGSRIGDGHQHY